MCNFIAAFYEKRFAGVKTPRKNNFLFDENLLITIYFILDDSLFRQIIGVPMGVDPDLLYWA